MSKSRLAEVDRTEVFYEKLEAISIVVALVNFDED